MTQKRRDSTKSSLEVEEVTSTTPNPGAGAKAALSPAEVAKSLEGSSVPDCGCGASFGLIFKTSSNADSPTVLQ